LTQNQWNGFHFDGYHSIVRTLEPVAIDSPLPMSIFDESIDIASIGKVKTGRFPALH
jgi:hypothetical protein